MPNLLKFEDKKEFKVIVNAAQTEAEILIYDQIGESFFGGGITATAISKELKALPQNLKVLNIRINSPGGDVFIGMTIFELLKKHKAKKVAYIDGMSASIASVIMLAADEIVMGEGAMVMIHKPMAGVFGNDEELEKMSAILQKIESQMIGIYSRKTGLSEPELRKYLNNGDTWFTSQEAVDIGFADRVSGKAEKLKVAASMMDKAEWIKNKVNLQATDNNRTALNNRLIEMKAYLARK
jgi:ATP-dependent Clp protease protease subunit